MPVRHVVAASRVTATFARGSMVGPAFLFGAAGDGAKAPDDEGAGRSVKRTPYEASLRKAAVANLPEMAKPGIDEEATG